jgi:DNA-binding winged helix-turn-helix (wHTH) protein
MNGETIMKRGFNMKVEVKQTKVKEDHWKKLEDTETEKARLSDNPLTVETSYKQE